MQMDLFRKFYENCSVGDGSPVPKPIVYGFAETNAKIQHITAGTGNPSPTIYYR